MELMGRCRGRVILGRRSRRWGCGRGWGHERGAAGRGGAAGSHDGRPRQTQSRGRPEQRVERRRHAPQRLESRGHLALGGGTRGRRRHDG